MDSATKLIIKTTETFLFIHRDDVLYKKILQLFWAYGEDLIYQCGTMGS